MSSRIASEFYDERLTTAFPPQRVEIIYQK